MATPETPRAADGAADGTAQRAADGAAEGRAPTPVGVLVGFLGSGKTTTLNHLLRGVHGKKIAVVVNEFGAVDVDSGLVAREVRADAELISLSNACICCKLRGDLLRAVVDLTERFDLDYILVESTGLGEAAPIAQTFFAPNLEGKVRLDAVITVVDAAHFWETYGDAAAEGQLTGEDTPRGLAQLLAEQLEFADVVLLNKTDLAGEEATARLESFVRELNPRARIVPTRFGDVDPETLLYTGSFDLAEVDETEEWQAAEAELEHIVEEDEDEDDDDHEDEEDSFGFTSFVYETGRPFDLDRLRREIFERWGSVAAGVVRSKGVLQAAGSDEAIQWNQAGGRCALESVGTWAPGAARQTQLVFIGRETDADAVTEALDACTVEPVPAASPPAAPPAAAAAPGMVTGRVEHVLGR